MGFLLQKARLSFGRAEEVTALYPPKALPVLSFQDRKPSPYKPRTCIRHRYANDKGPVTAMVLGVASAVGQDTGHMILGMTPRQWKLDR